MRCRAHHPALSFSSSLRSADYSLDQPSRNQVLEEVSNSFNDERAFRCGHVGAEWKTKQLIRKPLSDWELTFLPLVAGKCWLQVNRHGIARHSVNAVVFVGREVGTDETRAFLPTQCSEN